jgi:putative sigma-54 modulation protein
VQINITTRHGNLTDATREKLTAKAEKLLKYFDRLSAIEVIVDLKSADDPLISINVSAEHKHDFTANAQVDGLWPSVDAVIQKLEQQLRKYKEKVQERHRNHELRRQEVITETEPESEAI